MLLRERFHAPDALTRAGQLALMAGIAAQRLVHPPTDFLQGVVAGCSGVLIGLSIVLDVRGLVIARRRRAGGQ